MMGEATIRGGFLTGGQKQVHRRAEFWKGWYPELQKEDFLEGKSEKGFGREKTL